MTPALSTKGRRLIQRVVRVAALLIMGLTFEVEEVALSSSDGLLLADDDGGHDLLSELGLTLLDGSEEHVTNGGDGEPIEASASAADGNHVKVLGSCVVSAVHDASDGQTC